MVLIRENIQFCKAIQRARRLEGQFVRFEQQMRGEEAAFAYDIPEKWSKVEVLTPEVKS